MNEHVKILVVDDDSFMRNATVRALKVEGYSLFTAENGLEAIEKAREIRPDLILLDVNMPVMDGIEALRYLKTDPAVGSAFVVIVSGSRIDTDSQVIGLNTGADDYLTRPISNRELLARVQAMLRIKAAEQEAKRKEKQLHDLIASNVDGMLVLDHAGRILFANPAANELLDRSLENIIGQEIGIPISSREHADINLIRKDGSECIAEMRIVAIDWEGQPAHLAALRDVTARNQMQNAISASQKLLQDIIDNSTTLIYALDGDGKFLLINRRLEEVLGASDKVLLGKTRNAFLPPDVAAAHRANDLLVLEQQKVFLVEEENREPDGVHTYLSLKFPLVSPAGVVYGIGGISTDITARKEAEVVLRESEERFRTLVEEAPVGIFIQVSNQFAYVNKAALSLFGADKPDQLLGKKVVEQFDPEVADQVRERIRLLNEERRAVPVAEEAIITLDGRRVEVDVSAVPFLYQGERGALVFAQEITIRKEAERLRDEYEARLKLEVIERTKELREAQDQLLRQQRLAVLGQLAGSVGHELRNPLGVINNAVYFLRLIQPDASEKIKEYLGIIESEVGTADKIINDLLHFGREKKLDIEPTTVSRIIDETMKRFPPPAGIEVELKFSDTLPVIRIDRQQMVQVLGNLLVNAYQAMQKGGTINLAAQHRDNWITISVQDAGTGISPENMSRLFEPLFTTKPRGIGLGLSVSKKLTEANQGRIEVESEIGRGTKFSIYLPVSSEDGT